MHTYKFLLATVMTSIQRIACQRTAVLGRVNSRLPLYLGYSPRLSVLRENDGDEAGEKRGEAVYCI